VWSGEGKLSLSQTPTTRSFVDEEGDVIAGHGRLAAARLLEAPVMKGLSEVQRRQLVRADNRIALNGGWDMEMLRLELADLAALGADLKSIGFSKEELAAALSPASGGLIDEDEAPPLQETPISRPGDIWCPWTAPRPRMGFEAQAVDQSSSRFSVPNGSRDAPRGKNLATIRRPLGDEEPRGQ